MNPGPGSAAPLGGQLALITCAGSGLDAALADQLAGDGARIMAADIDPHKAGAVAARPRAARAWAHCLPLDVGALGAAAILVDRFPELDPAVPQDRRNVACPIAAVLSLLPMRGTCWP